MKNLTNFNEIFRKDVTYDNIKSQRKPGFYPLFRRYIFRKATDRGEIAPPPAVFGLSTAKFRSFVKNNSEKNDLNILISRMCTRNNFKVLLFFHGKFKYFEYFLSFA